MTDDAVPGRPHRAAGRWLAQQRRKRGLSQDQLAVLIGVRQGTISKYEQGMARPSDEVAVAIAQVFRLSERAVRKELGLYVPPAGKQAADVEDNVLRLPAGVTLTAKQRKVLDALFDMFLDDLERASG